MLNQQKFIAAIVLLCIAAGGLYYFLWLNQHPASIIPSKNMEEETYTNRIQPKATEPLALSTNTTSPEQLTVHISGAVKNPGVYTLPHGSRVMDGIQMAGGASEEADLEQMNLAAYLLDAQKIRIPSVDDTHDTSSPEENFSDKPTGSSAPSININQANVTELQQLPGVGPVIAQNIIQYREENGVFHSIEEIKNVPRIGNAIYEQMKHLITT